jgi:demethylmenaquinone methyltransferase/2-methoxy-6-polyprenyl-1,4-benzoquinol methylase
MRGFVPLVARLLGTNAESPKLMRYYWDTIECCAPPEQILDSIRAAGFTDVHRFVTLGIFSEYRALKPLAS